MKMFEESIQLDEVVLDFVKFGLRRVMPDGVYPQRLSIEQYRDIIHNWVTTEVSWMLLGKKIETRKYPATWWDALKNRWYPKFLKKWFPIEWDHFNLYNICPHINHAFPDNQALHLNWVQENSEFTTKGDNDE